MKNKRHLKIIEIIKKNDVQTQEDLLDLLKKAGFNVTQATVSRDIRELKLTKITKNDGKQKYELPSNKDNIKPLNIFKDAILYVECAKNMLVIKTLTGMAMAVATAIDYETDLEIMGCIAGDDTIFCVCGDEQKAQNIKAYFNQLKNFI